MVIRMNIYECRRYKSNSGDCWSGALIIVAESEQEAIDIFREYEHGNEPVEIEKLEIKKGILYEDYKR